MKVSRIALMTSVSLLCASGAYAADTKLIDIINNNGEPVTTETLNQEMLSLMQGRDNSQQGNNNGSQLSPCPSNSDPSQAQSAACLSQIAPAAGDDGDSGEEPAAEENDEPQGDDSLNDPAPPQEEPPPQEETPTEEVPDEPEPECSECSNEESPPQDEQQEEETSPGSETWLDLGTTDDLKIA